MNDDDLDLLVRGTAPRPDPGPDLDDVLQRMATGIRTRGGRRKRLLVAPLAAGAVLLTAAAGYAVWHDSASPGFESAVASHVSRLELPPGTDRDAYIALLTEQGRQSPTAVSDLAINSSAAYYGVCAWLTAWDIRHDAGDRDGAAEAVTALGRAVEAGPLRATDGGGVVGNLREVAAAAARGDRSPVAAELGANCAGLPLDGIR